jgi:O-succinylbenzoate synthase
VSVADDAPNYLPETIDTEWLALVRWAIPRVLGVRFAAPGDVRAALERDFRGHLMAKAAVEMGMWGVEAERAGIPLARLIGGIRERIEVGISLGIQATPEALVDKAPRQRRRESRDRSVLLMASVTTLDDSASLVAMDGLGLMMFEQPLAWDDIVRHAELQRRLNTPICLDESITSLERAQDMVTLGAGRVINIKPGRVGGFASSIAIHDFCEANGIPVWCGGMLESGIGRSYNVALASLRISSSLAT